MIDLTNWVVAFAKENLANERAWDVRYNLMEFSKEIFKEEFKQIEDDVTAASGEKDFFPSLRKKLQDAKWKFINHIATLASEAVDIIQRNGLEPEDFKYNGSPGYSFFTKLLNLNSVDGFKEPSDTVLSKLPDRSFIILLEFNKLGFATLNSKTIFFDFCNNDFIYTMSKSRGRDNK